MAIWSIVRRIMSDKRIVPVRLVDVDGGRVDGCYYPGDVISLDIPNLATNRNLKRLPDEPLDTDEILENSDKELAKMTVADLKVLAEEMEIDTASLNKKAKLIAALKQAMA